GDRLVGTFDEAHAAVLEAERRGPRGRVGGGGGPGGGGGAGRPRGAPGGGAAPGLAGGLPPGGGRALGGARAPGGQSPRARRAGRLTTAEAGEHFGVDVEAVLYELERDEELVRGELRPGGTEREWCDADVLRRLRRASLAALRKEVEPAEQAALGRFLPSWHGVGRRASLREALVPLQALALPVSLWESDVLPRRVPDYRPQQLDQLCASGERGRVGAGLDRAAVYFGEDAPVLGQVAAADRPEGEVHDRLRAALGASALFWFDLLVETGLETEEALPALWDLVWAGEVTNDAWQPLRAGRRYGAPKPQRRPRRFSRRRAGEITATQGRWTPTERLFATGSGSDPGHGPDRRSLAELLLERHGIVTR